MSTLVRTVLVFCRTADGKHDAPPPNQSLSALSDQAATSFDRPSALGVGFSDMVRLVVKPATVTAWQPKRLRDYWAALSQRRGPSRPSRRQRSPRSHQQLSDANIGWVLYVSWEKSVSSVFTWPNPRWRNTVSDSPSYPPLLMASVFVAVCTASLSDHSTPEPVAKSARRAEHRQHPPRLSRPHDRFQ